MKEALANIYRELSAGRIGRDEALDRIRALKHGGEAITGEAPGSGDAAPAATLLAEPAWLAVPTPDAAPMAFPRRRVLLNGWSRKAGDALAQGIADAACLVVDDDGVPPAQRFAQAALRAFAELRDLLDARDAGRALVQWVVADEGDDARLMTGLDGLFESASLEQPNLCGQVVFVPKDIDAPSLARLLASEATTAPERVVRHDRDGRRVRRWRVAGEGPAGNPGDLPEHAGLRERGVYLVTGGLGGLGLLVAAHLRQLVPSATLVLCGRGAPQGAAADTLARLQADGRVEYRQADVADPGSARALVDGIVHDHGALHGIFHGAGVLRDDFLQKKTADRFAEVLAPKVSGAAALDAASASLDLDLFVLSGSIASWAGNLGQTDYAAANGFLDAFAGWRAAKVANGERRGRSLSLAWPHWREGGMHVDAGSLRRLEQRTGLRSMETADGLRALHAALALPQPALMVMHGQPSGMRAALDARRRFVPEAAPVVPVTSTPPADSTASAGPGAVAPADIASRLRAFLREEFSAVLKIPAQRIEARAALEQYGIDSILAMSLTGRLEDTFGVLPKTLFFEYQTLEELAGYFEARHGDALARLFNPVSPHASEQSSTPARGARQDRTATEASAGHGVPGRQATGRPARARRRLRGDAGARPDAPSPASAFATVDAPIAIVGLSGRYPQSPDLDAFWRNLRDGRDCITEVPASRWAWADWFSEDATREGAHLSRWGGFIEGVDEFDPRFFNISPREAIGIDPQERLFLQHAWLALEDAGLTRAALRVPDAHGLSGQVGVYAGVMYGEYSLSGSLASIANRVSYFLNLHGPSLTLDTMCSSSLTALHLACQDLRLGRTALALAGGVNVSVHPNKYTMLSGGQFISRDGHCQSFGEGGDGYIPGEGVGIAVLKRLADAEHDGDRILGVIRATALNHGGKTNGYTVPNPQAQADVIARALREAGVDARHVSYIEAHGTGTKLGDPIEINALTRAFHGQGDDAARDAGWCLIGSAKSNIGHCESAAGIAGVTKVLLQMRHGQIVPSLHSRTLNPHIDFAATPFEVVQGLRPWARPVVDGIERPRIAGISSFGAGGSNAHVLIEEYRVAAPVAADAGPVLVPLSARTPEQLLQRARDLHDALRDATEPMPLDALAWTLQAGREAMDARFAIVAESPDALRAALAALVAGTPAGEGVHRALARDHRDEIAALDEDATARAALDTALARHDLAALAAWWVKGADIDWTRLRDGRRAPRRLSLPGYPFARERYWRDPLAAAANAALPPGARAAGATASDRTSPDAAPRAERAVAALHPLVHRNRSGLDGLRFESVFGAGDALLVAGALPDACLPAMALAALDLAAPHDHDRDGSDTRWALTGIAWGAPAEDIAGRPLQVSLLPDDGAGIAIEIHGADATAPVHLQAPATRVRGPLSPAPALAGLRASGQAVAPPVGCARLLLGEGEALAELDAPAPTAVLHALPGLLAALSGAPVVPATLAQVDGDASVEGARLLHARRGDDGAVDVTACDDAGRPLWRWRGLHCLVATASGAVASNDRNMPAARPQASQADLAPQASAAASPRPRLPAALRELPIAFASGTDAAPEADAVVPARNDGPVPSKPTNIALRPAGDVPQTPVEGKGRVRLASLSAARSPEDEATRPAATGTGNAPVRLFDAGEGLRVLRIEAPLSACAVALSAALLRAVADDALRAIRIEGAHAQAWQGDRDAVDALVEAGVFATLAGIETPILAVVAGDARGAGLLLASACTLLVADEAATFGFTDPDAGLFPTADEDAWFRARLGDALADDLLYRRTVRAGAALRAGGWSARFVPAAEVVASADALCASLATKSPLALGLLAGHLSRDLSPRLAALSAGAHATGDATPERAALCVSLCEDAAPETVLAPLFEAIARTADDASVPAIVLACSAPGGLPDTLPAEALGRAIDALVRCRVPVVAALDGDTGGAGWLLALACDAIVLRADAACTTSMHWHDPSLRGDVVALASLRLPAQLARRLTFAGGACAADALATAGVRVADDALAEAQALTAAWQRWPRAALNGWKSAQAARFDALRATLAGAQDAPVPVVEAATADAMPSSVVDLALRDDGVAVISLRDREARNMFTPALVAGLRAAFAAAEASPACRAIVVTGYDSWFATGGTVETLLAIQDGQSRFTDETVFQRALDCPLPVIAAIQGHGIGGGWSFGMFADLVLLSAESRYLSPYMGYGFTPGAGSTMTFPLRIGHDLARETLLTAEEIGGHVLRERGVALPVLPRREVPDAAIALAAAIAARPRAELVALKRLWTQGMRAQRDAVYARELDMHARTFVGNADTLATIRARFAAPKGAVVEEAVQKAVAPASAPPRAAATVDAGALEAKIGAMLAQELFLSADEIDPDAPFIDLGLDSITGVTWIRRINAEYGTDIEATKVYSHPTLRRLAALVLAEVAATAPAVEMPVVAADPAADPVIESGDRASGTARATTAMTDASTAASHGAAAAPAPRAPAGDVPPALVDALRAMLAQELFLQPAEIDEDTPFIELGLDSITGVTWVRRINAEYGVDIEATQVYNHPTLRRLAALVASALPRQAPATATDVAAGASAGAPAVVAPSPTTASALASSPSLSPSGAARPALVSWRAALRTAAPLAETAKADAMTRPIAIIGEAGRFPQAPDLDAFWRNLAEGRVCIGEIGAERWSLDVHYREGAPSAGFTNSKWLGALEDFDRFDPLFFSISPTEAESMDPQQRLFLQACWHALENAGRDPHGLSGARCGVFVGCGPSDYHQAAAHHRLSAQGFTGAATSILAARIAYFLDLRGPCVSIDTACSSSLVAIAQACDSLNSAQSDLALAGGVYVMGGPSMHIMTAQAGMLSADGRCHTFDARANGFVPGEGVGVVVLKRLEDARRDGDRIDAVIEGWGVNQDGRSNGITAPNQDAQTELLRSVYRRFGIDPDGIQLIEAHGTGTKLGDPIEVAGLKAAFAPFTRREGYCALGSVKSNIGHCLTAAGIAGVLKLVLSLRHRRMPPTAGFQRINEHIQLDGSPFRVNDRLCEWTVPAGTRRRSAVSSFGFSGTNAHLVIVDTDAAPATPRTADGPALVPLSARTPAQLRDGAQALRAWLDADAAATHDLQAIASTLQQGRHALGERVVFLVEDVAGLRDALDAYLGSRDRPGTRFEGQVKRDRPGLGLLLQDEDVRQTVIGKWLSERRFDRLGDVWAKGLDLDWRLLRPDGARRAPPVALPGYPFARDRYWLPTDDAPAPGKPATSAVALAASRPPARTTAPVPGATIGIDSPGSDAPANDAPTREPAGFDSPDIDPLSYVGEWRPVEPASEAPAGTSSGTPVEAPRTVLIVRNGDSHGLDAALRAHHADARVELVALDGEDAALLADDAALAARLRPLERIDAVYMLAIDAAAPVLAGDDALSAALDRNEGFLLRLLKTLRGEALVEDRIDTWILTAGTRADAGPERRWWGAGTTGLAHALAQGNHRFRVRSIDLSPSDLSRSGGAAALLPALLREPPSDRGEAIRLRHGRRERLSFLPLGRDRATPAALRHGGVYVVVGGSGIVGRIVTRRLLRDYAAHVVWIGRSPPDASKVRAALADAGSGAGDRLRYLQADAVDEAALRQAFAAVRAAHPRIHGVFFSGMVVGADDAVERVDPGAFRAIVEVKARGSRALHAALADEPLDFLCHFSSGQSYAFSGASRLSAYAAGIAFADSFVRATAAGAPFPVGIVNWGFWRSAVTERVQKIDGISTRSIHALEDDEGFACLERFLGELQQGRLSQLLCMRAAPEVEALMRCDPRQVLCLAEAAPVALRDAAGIAIDAARIEARIDADARHGLETLFVRLLYRRLRAMAGEGGTAGPRDLPALQRACGITGKYLPWLRQSLSLLEAAGLVGIDGDGGIDWRDATSRALADAAGADWDAGHAARMADPAIAALVGLAGECLQRLPEILRGTLAATDVIFPRGGMDKVGALYRANPTADTFNEIVAATVVAWVRERLAADGGGKLRILEVGAGTGGTSAPVLAALAPYRDAIAEYAYTDLSIAFFQHAERVHAPGNPFLVCRRLDIEQPIEPQGFAPGSYDLVLSTNALHATRNIRRTLGHVKSALRGDGLLVISEMCAARLATHLIFGLLDGWWLSEDPELRIPGNPGLTPEGWSAVLASEGFRRILLPGAQAQALGNQVIVAASDGAYRGQRGVETRVPPATMSAVPARSRAQATLPAVETRDPGTIAREGVLDALSATLKLDPAQVDPDLAFSDYGIDSILGVAFIERVNARFGLALNTAIVFEYASVSRLAAHLVQAWPGHLHAPPARADVPAPASAVDSMIDSALDDDAIAATAVDAEDVDGVVHAVLRDALSATLKIPAADIDPDLAFSDYGIDSILGVSFIDRVNAAFAVELNTAIVFEYASLARLARHLLAAHTDRVRAAARPAARAPVPAATRAVDVAVAPVSAPASTAATASAPPVAAGTGEIAIIGMSGQFPKAGNIEAFWRNLVDGVDGVDELPPHYLDQAAAWSADKRKGFTRCKWGGVLEDRDCFDPLFFSISPKEAESMNPHQRLVMQEGWNALEDAGYDPKRLAGSQTSVFVGAEPAGYIGHSFTGLSDAIVASRLSYVLDLRGAAFVINTGCSASAVAIHLGCESLRNRESDLVLAGGVNACVNQDMLVRLDQIEMLSPSGRCFTFDKGGDGTIISEGVAMLVLKRLEDAEADGDRILATVRASGINQDGASNGITAPNGAAQEALILSTYERFGIDARDISYVEAHGTGTRLGDPVETNALVRAFRRYGDGDGWCAIGSAKSHVGHAAAAAGAIGVAKVVLSMRHRLHPKLLNFRERNPLIEFDGSPFRIVEQAGRWDSPPGVPRMAALNSFGHSGTNAHLVLKEYLATATPPRPALPRPVAVPLSARTPEQLRQRAADLLARLEAEDAPDNLAAVAWTLQVGREPMEERLGIATASLQDLREALRDWLAGKAPAHVFEGRATRQGTPHRPAPDAPATELLRRWAVDGLRVTWEATWRDGARPARIGLPGYPFAKERYWMASALPGTGAVQAGPVQAGPVQVAPMATAAGATDAEIDTLLERIADDALSTPDAVRMLKSLV